MNNDITYFGKTNSRGREVEFGIKNEDRLKHIYVIGKTGMGKSTLLENMAVQDIKKGNGLAFIDPHGSAIETFLDYIPEHRINDVVYFAPFDVDYPISFNPLENTDPTKRYLVAQGLMSAFKKIFGEESFSDRMQHMINNTLLALLEYPGATLLHITRMLSDDSFRDDVIEYITDPSVKAY
jgi:DNA helicase HerA-like ATPase